MDKKACEEFIKDPLKDPVNGDVLNKGDTRYEELLRECAYTENLDKMSSLMDLQIDEFIRAVRQEYTSSDDLKKKALQLYISETKKRSINPNIAVIKLLSPLGTLLGEGSFGAVYSIPGTSFVCKQIKPTALTSPDILSKYNLREISSLHTLKDQQHVIDLEFIEKDNLSIYIPLYEKSLDDYLKLKGERLDKDQIRSIMFQILTGLFNMHNLEVYHRDIKPANVLLNVIKAEGKSKASFDAVLSDLGLSRYGFTDNPSVVSKAQTSFNLPFTCDIGTYVYMAPELIEGLDGKKEICYYDSKCDIWSVGMMFGELLSSQRIISERTPFKQLTTYKKVFPVSIKYTDKRFLRRNKYLDALFPESVEITDAEHDLIQKMLLFDPKERISVIDALKHPYFNNQDLSIIPLNPIQKAQRGDIKISMSSEDIDIKERFDTVYALNYSIGSLQSFYSAVLYLDICIRSKKFSDIKQVAQSCSFLAETVYEVKPSTVKINIELTRKILEELNYNLYMSTEYTYLIANLQPITSDLTASTAEKILDNAEKILLLALLDPRSRDYKKNDIANTCIGIVLNTEDEEIRIVNPKIKEILKESLSRLLDKKDTSTYRSLLPLVSLLDLDVPGMSEKEIQKYTESNYAPKFTEKFNYDTPPDEELFSNLSGIAPLQYKRETLYEEDEEERQLCEKWKQSPFIDPINGGSMNASFCEAFRGRCKVDDPSICEPVKPESMF